MAKQRDNFSDKAIVLEISAPPAKSNSRLRWEGASQSAKALTVIFSAGFIFGGFTWALGQFFQIRGVQQMLTSRIFLGVTWIFGVLGTWGIAWVFFYKRRKLIVPIGAASLLIAVIALDQTFPMTPTSTSAGITQPTSNTSTDWLANMKTPPTISDVFINDFPNTMRLHDEGEFHWKDISTVTHLKRQLYLDFPANNKFVGFYIPTTDPKDLSRTFEICIDLVRKNLVQSALDELPKKLFVEAEHGQVMTIQDLNFSGRVVIYHDDFLSTTQQADIIKTFAAKHYTVGFFGPDEFRNTLISWQHLHDAKAKN